MNGLAKDVIQATVTQLLVKDANGTPIAVFVEHGGAVLVSVSGDDDFEQVVADMGLEVTVVPVRTGK